MTHDQKVKLDNLIKSALDGNSLQRLSFDQIHNESIWVDAEFLPVFNKIDVSQWRIKPEPTREEITAQWVKDNDVKVGDKVRVTVDKPFMCKGAIYAVKEISNYCITCEGFAEQCDFNVDDIEKVTSKIVKFTFEDREEFRGKWVRWKNEKDEYIISSICDQYVIVVGIQGACKYSCEAMLRETIFVDGRPFGKEIWE